MKTKVDTTPKADIGDYMKVFACTAVMMQTVLSLVLSTNPSFSYQTPIGIIYNLVKFTAPAFIFGILYTTTRTTNQNSWSDYGGYMKKQWSALFVPTIWWTLTYLLIFPNVQQVNKFNDLPSFAWHFINGNAAPHLWYNTMMLQFIILMPLFWSLAHFVKNNVNRGILTLALTIILYGAWIYFYDVEVFHGPHETSWYLLDRLFISFVIYGIFGVISWMFRDKFEKFIKKSFPILVILFLATFYWTNKELFSFGYPVNLGNAPYYKPSMTLYALLVIGLVAALAIRHINKRSSALPVFHFLATYAYRAYLSNVFWLQIIWRIFGGNLAGVNPILAIIVCYLLTWVLSFTSAYVFHILWFKVKHSLTRSSVLTETK
jgi:peptidoglycan/LPS O-acetylase OafA/YrhL